MQLQGEKFFFSTAFAAIHDICFKQWRIETAPGANTKLSDYPWTPVAKTSGFQWWTEAKDRYSRPSPIEAISTFSNFTTALAVSGGVDSMALAFLCSHLKKAHWQNDFPHFHSNKSLSNFHFGAFIVDHKSRVSSTLESLKIREMLAAQGKHLLHYISNFEVLKVRRHSGRNSNVVLAVWSVSGESL